MDTAHWVIALLLGIGLAASSGLNTFMPLLMLSIAARFHLGGVVLNNSLAWVGSDTALVVLAIATVAELVGDKIPAVDHALHAAGTIARPAAGWLAAASVLGHTDPTAAAIVGLIIGAPTALGFHAAKSVTRVGTTATTLGIANPFVSAFEDTLSFLLALLSLTVPVLVPVAILLLVLLFVRLARAVRRRLSRGTAPAASSSLGP